MTLYTDILSALAEAMKAKDSLRVSTLRMVKAELLNVQKETNADTVEDEVVLKILTKEAKKRKESAKAFRDGDRAELAEIEEAELAIIEEYLPAQASEADIRAAVKAVVAESGSENFGAVMGATMKKMQGLADGGVVKRIVEEELKA